MMEITKQGYAFYTILLFYWLVELSVFNLMQTG